MDKKEKLLRILLNLSAAIISVIRKELIKDNHKPRRERRRNHYEY